MKLLDYGELVYVGFLYLVSLLFPTAVSQFSISLFLVALPTLIGLLIFVIDPAQTRKKTWDDKGQYYLEFLSWTLFSESFLTWSASILFLRRLVPESTPYLMVLCLVLYAVSFVLRILAGRREKKLEGLDLAKDPEEDPSLPSDFQEDH